MALTARIRGPAGAVVEATDAHHRVRPQHRRGRQARVVSAIADALRGVPGLRVLDVQSDTVHNRSVLTLAGDAPALRAGLPLLYQRAIAAIDLREHAGEHPRLGAVDVCPFIPIDGVTMPECVALAREIAADVARAHDLPVFLYEDAAASPSRRNLEDIRRGEFEGLGEKMTRPEWAPDFGPSTPHASAGATVIGARMPLIAYNINLGTTRLDVAKKIAAAVRMSSGGLRFVKAMGLALEDRGLVQVSMNLTNFEKTPVFRVFELVKREAARYGVPVVESEIVGLIPQRALLQAAEYYLQIEGFSPKQVLETRLAGDA
ncbi:MAG: glutamate formimidoyltransferase [Vicinamibacterales bacterium]